MIKKYFKDKKTFVSWLYDFKSWRVSCVMTPIDKINDLAPSLGIEFLGLNEVTGKDRDEGKFAGKEHYRWNKTISDLLPKKFPCVMILSVSESNCEKDYLTRYVYLDDFKNEK